jgi:hypothetical protein
VSRANREIHGVADGHIDEALTDGHPTRALDDEPVLRPFLVDLKAESLACTYDDPLDLVVGGLVEHHVAAPGSIVGLPLVT